LLEKFLYSLLLKIFSRIIEKGKKQLMSKLTELIVAALLPTIKQLSVEQLSQLLRKVKPDTTRHELLKSLYIPIDTLLEKYVQETKGKVDDNIVAALKEAIELVAAEDMIQLPNVDQD
jgi:hypothetical protein